MAMPHFNPLAPRGARRCCPYLRAVVLYFNPLAPRGARRMSLRDLMIESIISIHSPLAGRDCPRIEEVPCWICISIHSPLAGRDADAGNFIRVKFISIHSPLAGRDELNAVQAGLSIISIHSPLAGRDNRHWLRHRAILYFNPLAPRGARPINRSGGTSDPLISIHSPLAGRDPPLSLHVSYIRYFNPLAPRGARRQKVIKMQSICRAYCTHNCLMNSSSNHTSRKMYSTSM